MKSNSKFNKILYTFVVLILIGWGRLFHLQVLLKDHLNQLSQYNFTRLDKIYVPRGNIVDTHGKILATNKPIIELYWYGTGKRTLTTHQKEVLLALEEITHQSFLEEKKIKNINRAEQLEHILLLIRDIDFGELSCITEKLGHEPNLIIKSSFKRFYPYKKLASHAIGYLAHHGTEPDGKMGLEKIFQDALRGKPGIKRSTVNAIGKSLQEKEDKAGIAGQTIRTTLDFELQKRAEQSFPANWGGCFIIMDPETGALRTFLSRPNFDPSIFLKPLSHETWKTIQEKRPFLNRTCEACYPPASLFKLVTVAAALETGIVSQDTTCVCKGYYTFCNRKYHCNNHQGHGPITFKESLAQSCNIIFFKIAQHLSIDTLAEYANRFSLGKSTGIIFPEKTGLIPSSSWKLHTKGERWWKGETLSAVIGQSYLLVTPLQIARMLSSIFKGFLVKPRLLEDEEVERSELNILPSTLKFLRDSMKETVEYGTGQRLRNIENMEIYAKTGTAQISSLRNRYLNDQLREHAWLVANIQYKNTKPLTMVILVEHGGGSRAPALVAKKFLKNYQNYMHETEIKNLAASYEV